MISVHEKKGVQNFGEVIYVLPQYVTGSNDADGGLVSAQPSGLLPSSHSGAVASYNDAKSKVSENVVHNSVFTSTLYCE